MAKVNDVEVNDRREIQSRRQEGDRRTKDEAVQVERRKEPRRKAPRRRQIDPTTCERDYSSEEIAFMQALDDYKRTSGRMFPTCSEILEVLRSLGYQRVAAGDDPSAAGGADEELGVPEAVEEEPSAAPAE